ncbi:MAG TPA: metallophosphoesterase [Polyangiaceae bacterium]
MSATASDEFFAAMLLRRTAGLAFALMCAAATGSLTARADASPVHVRRGPYLQALSSRSVQVRAEFDVASPATLTLTPAAPGDAAAPLTVRDPEPRALHVLSAAGLTPATRYTYALTAGASTFTGELTTAPNADSRDPFTFLLYGDDRTDEAGHASVVKAMRAAPSDFLINTGDLVASGGSESDWQSFFDVESPLLKDRCVFACIGNHELIDGTGETYLKYFGPTFDAVGEGEPPKLYGSFRWADARFFLLDAMESFGEGPERNWIDDELARAEREPGLVWRIVVMHHGPWSAGPHGGNPRAIRAALPDLFSRHHVDLVVAGHDHIYERGFASGLRYLISGGGGAPVYPVDGPLPSTRKVESVRHFVSMTVKPESVTLVAQRDDGSLLDRCSFTKSRADWDCDPVAGAGAITPAQATAPLSRASSAKCACDTVGKPSRGGASILLGPLVVFLAFVARRRGNGN